MLGNILTFLILMYSVFFFSDATTSMDPHSTINMDSSPTIMDSTDTTAMLSVGTESDTDTTIISTSSTFTELFTTQIQPNSSVSDKQEQQGLTSGQIAGVAVGSFAGVAALGGGIYAGLKYTGKLGG